MIILIELNYSICVCVALKKWLTNIEWFSIIHQPEPAIYATLQGSITDTLNKNMCAWLSSIGECFSHFLSVNIESDKSTSCFLLLYLKTMRLLFITFIHFSSLLSVQPYFHGCIHCDVSLGWFLFHFWWPPFFLV